MQKTWIGDAMSTGIVSVVPSATIGESREVAKRRNVRHLLVTADRDLVGIACMCDLAPAVESQLIASFMATPVVTIAPDTKLAAAADVMRTRRVGSLPVLENGQLVGIVTRGDLRRLGFADEELGILRCVACGWGHNVVAPFGAPDVGFCLYCRERSVPEDDNDLGGSG